MASTVPTTPATLRVTVTANHIAQGRRESCYECPIELALISAGLRSDDVAVGRCIAWINDREYALPEPAQEFIRRFDEGVDVEPFSFELVAQ